MVKFNDRPDRNSIEKAVIPAAGFGTRLFPASQVVKKELFPIVDRHGRTKPAIVEIVEEAIGAGIEEVAIVVQPGDRSTFETLFKQPPKPDLFRKLKPHQQEYSEYIQELGKRVTLLIQDEPKGYGYAVFCAKDWVRNEPFMLLLGDHIYASDLELSCAAQLKAAFDRHQQNIISLRIFPGDRIHQSGGSTGTWLEPGTLLSLTHIAEKPTREYARQHLRVEGLGEDECLAMFGIYILEPQIFEYLEDHITQNFRENGEFQLTSCLEKLRSDRGMLGYLIQGRCFDFGIPENYYQTVIDFGNL
ncbi:MAG TPA: UTP--glucose-1-phosphate uridylyltransferase [Oscillatoriales cyanobacterium M59_W2019_021]|nr:MAG: UTP--glucose-1-phosphate uridylyltransferase [Cyanobacteria bacterium J055]HIK32749.1 UTP--glucose-1-phosphate uridylyltransferase [Oscillatoriales cyanobacterium M4454_W2019_049]HIK52488.1 UTP--glucose-1-phosphate uridylyltransferase [Oscillatoriales cyanobacterium M59_W2019_021]